MSTPPQPFSVGDRVVYLDPDRPYGDPGMVTPGEVTAVDDQGVTVLYDWLRDLAEGNPNHARTIWFAVDDLARNLALEERYRANPGAVRPARASWVRGA